MGGNFVKKNIGEKDGTKSMGEKFVKITKNDLILNSTPENRL